MSGERNSQWRVVNRCFRHLHRLMQGPATTHDLLEIIRSDTDETTLDDRAVTKRLENDRQRLREWLGCELHFDRSSGLYTLVGIDFPLISLPTEALRGLAFLQSTFSKEDVLMGSEVSSLIHTLLSTLSDEQQKELARVRGVLELDLSPRDNDSIGEDVWEAVRESLNSQRLLEFEYFSPSQSDRLARKHQVEPQRYFFDPVRGHYYLEGYCLETQSTKFGRLTQEKIMFYRLGRIRSPIILPRRFAPGLRHPKVHELVYLLDTQIARQGVTEHFPNCGITYLADGRAEVRASSTNLFMDLRTLLHYGPSCQVTGGEQAVREMKYLVEAMYRRYEEE